MEKWYKIFKLNKTVLLTEHFKTVFVQSVENGGRSPPFPRRLVQTCFLKDLLFSGII